MVDPLTPILAVAQLADGFAKVSLATRHIYREFKEAPQELEALSNSLGIISSLLHLINEFEARSKERLSQEELKPLALILNSLQGAIARTEKRRKEYDAKPNIPRRIAVFRDKSSIEKDLECLQRDQSFLQGWVNIVIL
jgi:hypothetical protein